MKGSAPALRPPARRPTLEELPEIMRVPVAAIFLDVSVRTFYRLIDDRAIGYFKVSERGIRIRRDQLATYLQKNTHRAESPGKEGQAS